MFGYTRRVKNSFVGVIFGLLLVPGSVVLHSWNEYRTIHRSRGLAEAQKIVVSIPDSSQSSPDLNEKLVHLTGFAQSEQTLEDAEFGVAETAIHLARRVQMFQWIEHKESRQSSDNSSKASYSYRLDWADGAIDSSKFHRKAGHENPPVKFEPKTWSSDQVFVGTYHLNKTLVKAIDSWEPVDVPFDQFIESVGEDERLEWLPYGKELYHSVGNPNPEDPQLGDLRIAYEKVVPTDVSLVAALNGNTFAEYHTSNGEGIQRLYLGSLSASEVMNRLVTENTILAWGLRFFGTALCVLGLALALKPLSAILSFVPFLGELTAGLTFVVALLLGSVISLTTIGIAWIAVRPALSIALLAIAAAGLFVAWKLRKQEPSSKTPDVIDASMLVD